MNMVLRSTDIFESFSRNTKFFVRFVDAKFAMPKTEKDEGCQFVCLDSPEYPAEHDDIMIGFDTEEGECSRASN